MFSNDHTPLIYSKLPLLERARSLERRRRGACVNFKGFWRLIDETVLERYSLPSGFVPTAKFARNFHVIRR